MTASATGSAAPCACVCACAEAAGATGQRVWGGWAAGAVAASARGAWASRRGTVTAAPPGRRRCCEGGPPAAVHQSREDWRRLPLPSPSHFLLPYCYPCAHSSTKSTLPPSLPFCTLLLRVRVRVCGWGKGEGGDMPRTGRMVGGARGGRLGPACGWAASGRHPAVLLRAGAAPALHLPRLAGGGKCSANRNLTGRRRPHPSNRRNCCNN